MIKVADGLNLPAQLHPHYKKRRNSHKSHRRPDPFHKVRLFLLHNREAKAGSLEGIDLTNNTALFDLEFNNNPGDGTTFLVEAWFDDNDVPDNFTTGTWGYDGNTITIEYRNVD